MRLVLYLLATLFIFSGCSKPIKITPISLQPTDKPIKEICILKNPRVIAKTFVSDLQFRLEERGIKSYLVEQDKLKDCPYHMEYIAKQSWGFKLIVTYINLDVYKGTQLIGNAMYSLDNINASSDKFSPAREKLVPLIEGLFPTVKDVE